jgi:hypothetical protein
VDSEKGKESRVESGAELGKSQEQDRKKSQRARRSRVKRRGRSSGSAKVKEKLKKMPVEGARADVHIRTIKSRVDQ